ncbi:MAG: transcriptional regulator [Kiritimatiellae bacterium]|nr:transcriptional regulator [Kiritimatiellia bacterium]
MQVIVDVADVGDMCSLFNELMTKSEMNGLAKRWQLMEELIAGKTQRAIAAELGVSLCKITRGAKILKRKNSISGNIIKQRKVE